MRTPTTIVLLLLAGLALPAAAQMPPAQVILQPVEQRSVTLTKPLVATVEPVTRSTLAAEEAGLVKERFFDEGQRVEKNKLLARADTVLLDAKLAAAKAAHASALAMVDRAQADVTQAERELKRLTELRKEGGASEKELQDAIALDAVGQAMLKVRKAEAAEKLEAVTELERVLEKAKVYSPFEGVVSKRYVEVGQWVKQGDPIADVVQMDPLHIRVHVPEEVIAGLSRDTEAQVTFDALRSPDGKPRTITAKVDQILPEADPASRTFTVKLLAPNPEMTLRPGFFARVAFSRKLDVADGFLVPRDAVVSRGEQAHVVVMRDGKAAIVRVTRGVAEGNKTIVYGELKQGEMVVVRGNESVMEGQTLIPVGGPPPGAGPAQKPAAAAAPPATQKASN
jgi:RND family efflux transporter MFP subunit